MAITRKKNMTHRQFLDYKTACRIYREDHPEVPHNRHKQEYFENRIIEEDPAIIKYFNTIRSRQRNDGYLSNSTKRQALNGIRHFIEYLSLPITEHVASDLVRAKQRSLSDFTIDDKLEEFANLQPVPGHRCYATAVKGLFRSNRAPLQITIDNHFEAHTKPISEAILSAIREEVDEEKRNLIDYQAYSGQRITCLATVPLEQIDMSRENFSVIHIFRQQNKSRQNHDTIVPKKLMERILERCKELHLRSPFPQYSRLWSEITAYAMEKYEVRLTSHYLRKRFASIASDTPMDANQWDYLMGSKKNKGHGASVYNLTFLDVKLIPNYQRYLLDKLSIIETQQTFTPRQSTETALLDLVKQQQQTINDLSALLAKSALPTSES